MKTQNNYKNIKDFLSPEEYLLLKARLDRKLEHDKKAERYRVTPEIYLLSKFGLRYGFDAIMAVIKNEISLEWMYALLEGAEKIRYAELVDSARGVYVANSSANAEKKAAKHFKKGVEPWVEKAEIK